MGGNGLMSYDCKIQMIRITLNYFNFAGHKLYRTLTKVNLQSHGPKATQTSTHSYLSVSSTDAFR